MSSKKYKNKLFVQEDSLKLNDEMYHEKYFVFSFRYLTKDSKYNFDDLRRNPQLDKKSLKSFSDKLKRISQIPISQITQQSKKSGFEIIKRDTFDVTSVFDEIDLVFTPTKDMQYHIFRFGSQEKRLVCKKDNKTDTLLYIICVDWDLTLYSHEH